MGAACRVGLLEAGAWWDLAVDNGTAHLVSRPKRLSPTSEHSQQPRVRLVTCIWGN